VTNSECPKRANGQRKLAGEVFGLFHEPEASATVLPLAVADGRVKKIPQRFLERLVFQRIRLRLGEFFTRS
jgi:hypothetical protein